MIKVGNNADGNIKKKFEFFMKRANIITEMMIVLWNCMEHNIGNLCTGGIVDAILFLLCEHTNRLSYKTHKIIRIYTKCFWEK